MCFSRSTFSLLPRGCACIMKADWKGPWIILLKPGVSFMVKKILLIIPLERIQPHLPGPYAYIMVHCKSHFHYGYRQLSVFVSNRHMLRQWVFSSFVTVLFFPFFTLYYYYYMYQFYITMLQIAMITGYSWSST